MIHKDLGFLLVLVFRTPDFSGNETWEAMCYELEMHVFPRVTFMYAKYLMLSVQCLSILLNFKYRNCTAATQFRLINPGLELGWHHLNTVALQLYWEGQQCGISPLCANLNRVNK